MYHIDNYKVDNGDDSADSDSDIGVTANVDTITGGTKRRNFDIGNTSTLAARRKLNLHDTATFGRVNVGQPHIQQTSTQFQDLPLELKL
ncbi:hypothetical protein ACOSP7_027964 [Xanthoceras sorbifolium]